MTIEPALKVEKLVKDYGSTRAVDGVSFDVAPGEVFGLLGPNGAGKTTTISMITTLTEPTSGKISIFGYDNQVQVLSAKKRIGVVPQEIVNHGYFSVEEILEFQSGYFGVWKNTEKINYLLDRLHLTAHRTKKVRQLSGGMKRRLMIAKSLVHSPKLLLLDEPTAGVDIELRTGLWRFVEELRDQGVSILLTTHYLEEAEILCSRIGVIHRGSLIKMGKTKDLVAEMTMRHISVRLPLEIQPMVNIPECVSNTGGLFQYVVPAQWSVGDLIQQAKLPAEKIIDINIKEGSLEEAFLRLVREN